MKFLGGIGEFLWRDRRIFSLREKENPRPCSGQGGDNHIFKFSFIEVQLMCMQSIHRQQPYRTKFHSSQLFHQLFPCFRTLKHH